MSVAITEKLYHRLVRLACSYAAQQQREINVKINIQNPHKRLFVQPWGTPLFHPLGAQKALEHDKENSITLGQRGLNDFSSAKPGKERTR